MPTLPPTLRPTLVPTLPPVLPTLPPVLPTLTPTPVPVASPVPTPQPTPVPTKALVLPSTPVQPPPVKSFPGGTPSAPCNSLWEVHPEAGDTCEKIASLSGLGNVAALLAINSNPPLDCSKLKGGHLVCSGDGKRTNCGSAVYSVKPGDTCNTIRQTAVNFTFPQSLFNALNPGQCPALDMSVC